MKKFIVEFEGEEEYGNGTVGDARGALPGEPEFLLFSSEGWRGAVSLCKWLAHRGIPSWIVKYKHSKPLLDAGISDIAYFAAGVRRGPGVTVDENRFAQFVPGRHSHIQVTLGSPSLSRSTLPGRMVKDADPIENADIIDIQRWNESTTTQ